MADTSVKIFDSSMTGAPTIGGASGGSLIAVLNACLQDGFGLKTIDSLVISGGVATATISTGHSAVVDSVVLIAGATVTGGTINGERKVTSITGTTVVFDATGISDQTATGTITLKLAPAGWTKAFSGTNLAAYKSSNPAASGCYLRVDDTGTANARVVGYESMIDINTGTGPFPTTAQVSGGQYWAKANNTTGTRKWWVVADDRFIYLGVANHATYADDYRIYCFGDIVSRKSGDAYRALLAGPITDNSASTPGASQNALFYKVGATSAVVMPRSYTQIGSAIQLAADWGGNASAEVSGLGGRQYPNGPDNGLLLEKPNLWEGISLAVRGTLPGCYVSQQAINQNITNDFAITSIPGLSGRKLLWKIIGANSAATRGGFALDITGPWV